METVFNLYYIKTNVKWNAWYFVYLLLEKYDSYLKLKVSWLRIVMLSDVLTMKVYFQ